MTVNTIEDFVSRFEGVEVEAKIDELIREAYYEAGMNVARCKLEIYLEYYAILKDFCDQKYRDKNESLSWRDGKQVYKDLDYMAYEYKGKIPESVLRKYAINDLLCPFIGHMAEKTHQGKFKNIKSIAQKYVTKSINTQIIEYYKMFGLKYQSSKPRIVIELVKKTEKFIVKNWDAIERVKKGLLYKGYLSPNDIRILTDYKDMLIWDCEDIEDEDYEYEDLDDENYDYTLSDEENVKTDEDKK